MGVHGLSYVIWGESDEPDTEAKRPRRRGRTRTACAAVAVAAMMAGPAEAASVNAGVLAFDVLSSGAIAGWKAKKQGRSFWRAFLKGGGVGGSMSYAGTWVARQNEDTPGAGLLGKLIVDQGSSVTENVIEGRPMFSRLRTHVGPMSLTLDWRASGEDRARWRLMPAATAALVTTVGRGDSLDWQRTLTSGVPIFTYSDRRTFDGHRLAGVSQGGLVSLDAELADEFWGHEITHALQFRRYERFRYVLPERWRDGLDGRWYELSPHVVFSAVGLFDAFGTEGHDLSPLEYEAEHGFGE